MTPYFLKMNTLPSLAFFLTLIRDIWNFLNVSDSTSLLESYGNGILMTYLPLHAQPLFTPTLLAGTCNIGGPNFFLSFLLR